MNKKVKGTAITYQILRMDSIPFRKMTTLYLSTTVIAQLSLVHSDSSTFISMITRESTRFIL